jgi:hypothetical protein
MSVNPNLATLMNLVDELQDQMPEGKYLEAMNALRDLHVGRVRPPPQPVRPAPALPLALVVPEGHVRLTLEDEARMTAMIARRRQHNENLHPVVKAWRGDGYNPYLMVRKACGGMIESEWCGLTAEQRLPLVISALRWIFSHATEDWSPNPDAEVCPFMSRHAIGRWFDPARRLIQNYNGHESYDRARWNCVCGSKDLLCKNWETHKHSDKHRKWHEAGRKVGRGRTQEMRDRVTTLVERGEPQLRMEGKVREEELLGVKIKWTLPYYTSNKQDRNEWTHPHLFAGKPLNWTPPKNYSLPLMAQLEEPAVFSVGAVEMPREYLPVPDKQHRWCPRTRTHVPTMSEEQYAIFISLED